MSSEFEALERERMRLESELAAAHAARAELARELETALQLLEESDRQLTPVFEAVETSAIQLRALSHRKRVLERRVVSANATASAAQARLAADREWVVGQVRSVEASQSWRVGHRLVRAVRAVAFRHDRGADGLTVIIRRMEDGGGNSAV
jgi:chromosome segregation ATPase